MKILVVEDEVQLADTLAEILKRNKYNVDTVFDGDDGLEYARTGIYDCILLDIMLPVRSGTEIVQILRREKNATPIMLLSAGAWVAVSALPPEPEHRFLPPWFPQEHIPSGRW